MKVFIFIASFTFIVKASQNFYYEKGVVDTLSFCPGEYCGRMLLPNGSWSACSACERGYRRNESSACDICISSPLLYDWMYLGFMAVLPVIFHFICIDVIAAKKNFTKEILILYAISLAEVALGAIIALLVFPPRGSFSLLSCPVYYITDWYPVLRNPNPNYEGVLYCTQEAVYPLYSILFVFYTLCLVIMCFVRAWLSNKLLPNKGQFSIYAALYFYPILIFCHAILAGILYYIYPSLILAGSVISNAAFFARQPDQEMSMLFYGTLFNPRNLCILLGHWFLHAYGIVAINQLANPIYLWLIPLPALFYILTSKFSDPDGLPS